MCYALCCAESLSHIRLLQPHGLARQAPLSMEILQARLCELLIAKFRLKLKKVGKTTRPFRYDLRD